MFKKGDKVVCIKKTHNGLTYALTIDRLYTIREVSELDVFTFYLIKDDDDQRVYYRNECFISVKEHRNYIINNILA